MKNRNVFLQQEEKHMEKNEEIKLTYSAVVSREGKPFVSVMFERGEHDIAEGSLPSCEITYSSGFSEKEIKDLTDYLKDHRRTLIENAKQITGIRQWF